MSSAQPLTYRGVFALAGPIIVANLSTPLLGMVDTAVVGRLPDPAYIGAVALGSLIFTFVFWAFGFLRMGTTGLTAQARGSENNSEVVAHLARALMLAGFIGLVLIALKWPLKLLLFDLIVASAEVEALSAAYFDLRILAAPATLANYALIGWFVGLGQTRTALTLQLILNITNIVLDALLVLVFELDVRGVALGTLSAEYFACACGLYLARRELCAANQLPGLKQILEAAPVMRLLAVNRDIMIRSLALMSIFTGFMVMSARLGDVVLAANAILMQFVSASAYFLDGFAHAAETLVGHAVGAGRRAAVARAMRLTTVSAASLALMLSGVVWFAGDTLIAWLTVDAATQETAAAYLLWASLAPLLGVWAFQLDGIFIGATWTRAMRQTMLLALLATLAVWWLTRGWGNPGLWLSLMAHYVLRAAGMLLVLPPLYRGLK